VTERLGRRRRKLLDDLKEGRGYSYVKGGNSRSHCVDSSLWKRLWTCRETDCLMNGQIHHGYKSGENMVDD
jgi:hypothetical protein